MSQAICIGIGIALGVVCTLLALHRPERKQRGEKMDRVVW